MAPTSPRGFEFYFYCAVLIIGVVGTATNGLILYALVVSKQHKKHPLIVNQNILDLTSSFAMIITYSVKLCNPYLTGPFGKFLCVMMDGDNLIWWANSGAVVNLAGITVERYLKVVYPIWSKNKLRKWVIYLAIGISWIMANVSCVSNVASKYRASAVKDGICFSRHGFVSNVDKVIYAIWDVFSFYFVIIFIFVFCYSRILAVVRRQARVMAGHGAAGSSAGQAQSNQIQNNIIKTVVLVGVLYAISWLPMYIAAILIYVYPYALPGVTRHRMYFTTVFVGYSYMCTNPFIYATKFDPVKQVLLRMIPCKKANQAV